MSQITDQTLKILEDHHERLAAFGSENYAQAGRGLIAVQLAVGPTMQYCTLEQVRHHYRELLPGDEGAETIVRMVETYDPDRQAVIVATALDGSLVTTKLSFHERT